jgi:translation initiation factor 2 beta subunit (eIF-2beta)/eIF-5
MPTKININYDMKDDPFYRYKMDEVNVKYEGNGNGQRTIFLNVDNISEHILRPPNMIISYLSTVLGCKSLIDKEKRYVLYGTHDREIIQAHIYDFINILILCKSCKNPETIFEKSGKNKICLKCNACPEKSEIILNKITEKILKLVKF